MSNYTKVTNFTAKDSLPSGNANKIIKGAEFDTEFNAIATAIATKADSSSVTGTVQKSGDTMTGLLNLLTTTQKKVAVSGGTIDLSAGEAFTFTVSGVTTFTFTNTPATTNSSNGFILELTNGGSAAVTWPASVDWPSGTAPVLTTSGKDVLVFVTFDNGTNWRGTLAMKDSK